MRVSSRCSLSTLVLLTAATQIGIADDAPQADASTTNKSPVDTATAAPPAKPSPKPAFIYRPPNRGAPVQRVGGGTRSIDQLSALVPTHTGLTSRAQPRLYWFINPGFRNKVRFRLAEVGISPPLLEIQLPPQPNGGIQYLDLAVHDVRLEPGKHYEWGVMLEPFPHQRLPPLISHARIAIDDSVTPLIDAPAEQKPFLAAQQGYWYDALDWVSQLMESNSADSEWRLQRASLLEQGHLMSAAMYEREMAKSGH